MKNTTGHQKLRAHLAALRRNGDTQATFAEALSAAVRRPIKQGSISRWAHGAMPSGDVIVGLQILGVAEPHDFLCPAVDDSGPLPITPDEARTTGTDD